MNVTLTDNAITKIREIFKQDPKFADKALRVYIETGGCNGYSYGFKFDEAKDSDFKQSYENFNVVIDQESGKLLDGATIDYRSDFGSEGFAIKNPNAKKSCGCGNSFDA